jgi:hypothetical protein
MQTHPFPTERRTFGALRFSSRRTNRGATQRYRNRCAHHFQQHANASSVIEPLKRAHEIGKGPG